MVKKIFFVMIILSIVGITTVSMLPTSHGIGHTYCVGKEYLKGKSYIFLSSLTNSIPAITYDGGGNTGYTGSGDGAERIPVLMYHFIIPKELNGEPGNGSIINLESFEAGMDYLYQEGYYTASLSELEDYVHGNIKLPEKTVVITFDDGYENNYIYAYPILKKYNFKASIFIVGTKIQEETTVQFNPKGKSYFSKEQIEQSQDVFDFYSHTYNLHHKEKSACNKDYAATRQVERIKDDTDKMKQMGIDTTYFAYPFGEFSGKLMHALIDNGYRMSFTVAKGFVEPGDNPMYLKRLNVYSDTKLSELIYN